MPPLPIGDPIWYRLLTFPSGIVCCSYDLKRDLGLRTNLRPRVNIKMMTGHDGPVRYTPGRANNRYEDTPDKTMAMAMAMAIIAQPRYLTIFGSGDMLFLLSSNMRGVQ